MGTRTPGGVRSRKRSSETGLAPAPAAVAAGATTAATMATEAAGTPPPVAPPLLVTLVLITERARVLGANPETVSRRYYYSLRFVSLLACC
uniref:Uncharacterized protein n=1 Tax=Arundo donax TaxID=35708 RepID=A0A0A9BC84_ARUDO